MTSNLPDWLTSVPLKTVGVLCATHIFGRNIESRQIVLAGKRYFHNAVENVVGYVLNPVLPPLDLSGNLEHDSEAVLALQNVRDCFNYIFHIQVEYFKILHKLMPERFRSKKTGEEFHLNQFAGKGPTLINSEKRYRILSKIDGAQPYDLDLDWNADFDWIEESVQERFADRLIRAQDAYADTLNLGKWYRGRDRNLIIPLKTIMDDLSDYFEHIGLAAYLIARNSKNRTDDNIMLVKDNLSETCRHLERFTIDMMRMNVFSIVKHDIEKLEADMLRSIVQVRSDDDSYAGHYGFVFRHEEYAEILNRLYEIIGFEKT